MSTTSESSLANRFIDSIELYRQGKFQEAENGFLKCVENGRTRVDSTITLIESLNGLATVYFARSKFPEALDALREALSSLPPEADNSESKTWKACLLNNQARVYFELEQLNEVESNLVEAISLLASKNAVYAAELHANFLRFIGDMPRWRDKIGYHVDEFQKLQAVGSNSQVYLDDMANWRRPGLGWDIDGPASPESLEARLINNRLKLIDDQDDAKAGYESILRLEEESRQVAPNVVSIAYMRLAEISAQTGDLQLASKYCDDCSRFVSSCYIGAHVSGSQILLKLAGITSVIGHVDQAKKLVETAKALVTESLGVNNPQYARCISAEALLFPVNYDADQNATGGKLKTLYRSRDIMKEVFPGSHSAVIHLNLMIVKTLIGTNRLDEGEALLNEVSGDAHDNQVDSTSRQQTCLLILAELRIKQSRINEAEAALKMSESMLEQIEGLSSTKVLKGLDYIGGHYLNAGLFVEGERIFRKCVEVTASMSLKHQQDAQKRLALCLLRAGKTTDAGDVIGNIGANAAGDAKGGSRRDELVSQSHLAWSLSTKGRFAQAKLLAEEVVNEAHLLIPEQEQAVIGAFSVLMDDAKRQEQPDEMLRLIGTLSGKGGSIRVLGLMPMLYLEAAQLYAKQKSIKAEAIFDKAIKCAEDVQSRLPQCLDGALIAYMNYCTANRKNELALKLCERLISLRTAISGTNTFEYAVAITAKARLLSESDANGAEALSLEAFNILNSLTDPTTRLQLLITVSVRESILKKLFKFEEAQKMAARSAELRAELDSQMALLKASREMKK